MHILENVAVMEIVAGYVKSATVEVFESMVMMEIAPGEPAYAGSRKIDSSISSMIGLAGDLKGMVIVHCPDEVAKVITSEMLGMEIEQIDDDVKDALGEIANMVAGGLKVSLVEQDCNVELALPSTVIGRSVRMSSGVGTKRVMVPFEIPSGEFGVEMNYVISSV